MRQSHRHDDHVQAARQQAALEGKGDLVVQEPGRDARPLENDLSGDEDRVGIPRRDLQCQRFQPASHIRIQRDFVLSGQAMPARQRLIALQFMFTLGTQRGKADLIVCILPRRLDDAQKHDPLQVLADQAACDPKDNKASTPLAIDTAIVRM